MRRRCGLSFSVLCLQFRFPFPMCRPLRRLNDKHDLERHETAAVFGLKMGIPFFWSVLQSRAASVECIVLNTCTHLSSPTQPIPRPAACHRNASLHRAPAAAAAAAASAPPHFAAGGRRRARLRPILRRLLPNQNYVCKAERDGGKERERERGRSSAAAASSCRWEARRRCRRRALVLTLPPSRFQANWEGPPRAHSAGRL